MCRRRSSRTANVLPQPAFCLSQIQQAFSLVRLADTLSMRSAASLPVGPAGRPVEITKLLKTTRKTKMTKPKHKLKKANHGARPANAKSRKAKRKKVRT